MSKKMLVNAMHPEEARVAIVEDGRLLELDIEIAGKEQIRGNVYKGVVVRVEPGLQAAFVDIGLKKLAFLQMSELHPDCWQWREDIPEEQRHKRPRIQEILRRGQELLVQVEKGERDMKGAALTTYLSLPGRYMVVMPGSDSTGISRKVEDEKERKKLKELVAQLEIPENYGYIIRTEAVGKRKTELSKDFQYLVKLTQEIKDKAAESKAPVLIYQESDVVTRTIRDYFNADIDEVLVDSKEVYKQTRAFFKATMPKFEKIVKMHQEKRPIFSKYQLEEQIDLIHEKKVPLKSGGSLVIEPTEALVSIDVNSGKTTGEKGIEETAFKTNMEAAEEAARQLRLRDLGGLIVIDFIDMRDRKHNAEVEKILKNALKADKARVTVGKISQFGILEMSRQRIKPTLEEASHLNCPHCEGRGKVKSVEAMAISFLRKVHAAAAKGTVAEVKGSLPLEVAYYLLNRKKREIAGIEDDYEIEVTIKGKPSFLMNQLELDVVRREKAPHDQHHDHKPLAHPPTATVQVAYPETDEAAEAEEERQEAAAAAAAEQLPAEEGKKRKRKRRKKKTGAAEHPEQDGTQIPASEPAPLQAEATLEESASEKAEGHDETGEPAKKKRRRRRRRGKGGAALQGASEEAVSEIAPAVAPVEVPAVQPEPGVEAAASEVVPKKKPRRKPKNKGVAVPETTGGETVESPQEQSPAPPQETAAQVPEKPAKPKPKRKPAKKKPATAKEETPPPAEPVVEAVPEPEKKKKPARPRAKAKKNTEPTETE